MNTYKIYYNSLYRKSDWPPTIDADSYYVHTVRDPGYMTDTVSFYRMIGDKKTLTATICRVDHIVMVKENVKATSVPVVIPQPAPDVVETSKKTGWFRIFSVTKK